MLLGPLAFELCFLSFIALYLQGSSRRHRERQNLEANEQDRNIETICSAYCFALKRFVARALYACFTAGFVQCLHAAFARLPRREHYGSGRHDPSTH